MTSSLSTRSTNIEINKYKKIFSSRTVRKLGAIQFVNGLLLIVLHMLISPFYGEGETRTFTGGFVSGKKTVIVLMVLFYWVTGITGVICAKPINSRCSLCYLMTVIFVSFAFSLTLITNSILGFAHLNRCSIITSSTNSSIFSTLLKASKRSVEHINDYNCTNFLKQTIEINKFRITSERKILGSQITLSSIYLMLKCMLFVFISRKYQEVHSEVNQNYNFVSQSTETSTHSSAQYVMYSCCLYCILNIWSMSCKCNEADIKECNQTLSKNSSLPLQNDLTQTENSE